VKCCGRRPDAEVASHAGAGVRKSPVREPAGSGALDVPQTLWGFSDLTRAERQA